MSVVADSLRSFADGDMIGSVGSVNDSAVDVGGDAYVADAAALADDVVIGVVVAVVAAAGVVVAVVVAFLLGTDEEDDGS